MLLYPLRKPVDSRRLLAVFGRLLIPKRPFHQQLVEDLPYDEESGDCGDDRSRPLDRMCTSHSCGFDHADDRDREIEEKHQYDWPGKELLHLSANISTLSGYTVLRSSAPLRVMPNNRLKIG